MHEKTLSTRARTTADGRRWLVPLVCLLAAGSLLGLSTNLAKVADGAGLNPLTLLTWSVVGAAIAVTFINALSGRLPRCDRRTGEYTLVSALVGLVAPNLIIYAAVPRVGAGFVALTLAMPPLLTYLGALALRLERFDVLRAAGVGLALIGASYLAFLKLSAPDAPFVWIGATLLMPVLLAAGNIYRTVRWPAGTSPAELVPGVLVVASLALVATGAASDIPLRLARRDTTAVGLVILQAAALSAQYMLFFVLQKRGGPVYLSLLGSVAAIVGVPMAVVLLGEAPPAGLAVGAIMIAAGIVLVIRGGVRRRTTDLTPPSPDLFESRAAPCPPSGTTP